MTIWRPRVTVAAMMERDGRFLLVEEEVDGERVYNQPAGHWERRETLVEACAREALEESALRFEPRELLGVYSCRYARRDLTYLRFAFCGEIAGRDEGRPLDPGIVRTVWLVPEEIRALKAKHRSPLVMRCIEDYLSGARYPLALIAHFG